MFGCFVAPQVRQAEGTQLRFLHGVARTQHPAHQNVLAVMPIGDAHSGGIEHSRVAQQRLVNLSGSYVLTALDDQLFDAARDKEKAVAVPMPQVTRSQPAIGGKSCAGGFRVLVIPGHDVGAANGDLSGFAIGQPL